MLGRERCGPGEREMGPQGSAPGTPHPRARGGVPECGARGEARPRGPRDRVWARAAQRRIFSF